MIQRIQIQRRARRQAFTLMEVLVVVAILVALAGVAAFFVLPQLTQNKVKTARLRAMELTKAAETYYIDRGAYPNDIKLLMTKDNLGGPYVKKQKDLLDPWGNLYSIVYPGPENQAQGNEQPDIWCVDPQTSDKIGNW